MPLIYRWFAGTDRTGQKWDLDGNAQGRDHTNVLAARGHWLTFQESKIASKRHWKVKPPEPLLIAIMALGTAKCLHQM